MFSLLRECAADLLKRKRRRFLGNTAALLGSIAALLKEGANARSFKRSKRSLFVFFFAVAVFTAAAVINFDAFSAGGFDFFAGRG